MGATAKRTEQFFCKYDILRLIKGGSRRASAWQDGALRISGGEED